MEKQVDKILYAKPSITQKEIAYVMDAVKYGWGSNCNFWIDRFEDAFSKYIGTRHAIATSSATGALHLGLAALEIGQGDEVILADTNWIASVAPVVHLGAKPVFVDILSNTWCIDPAKVEPAITPKTKAIIAVHLYGNLCDMDALENIAAKYNLHLIEDAAEAIGSHWKEKKAGSRGIFGIFSLHGTKTMTTGEGGFLVTDNSELANKVNVLNNHGRLPSDKRSFFASYVGYKYKMSNIQAALGFAQLERVEDLVKRRRDIFFEYYSLIGNNPEITMNPIPSSGMEYGYWMPTSVFSKKSGITSSKILTAFNSRNIDARPFFSPLSNQANFDNCVNNIVSADIAGRAINLPAYHDMTDENIKRVASLILQMMDEQN